MPHCVAFECSNQAQTKQDPKLPKDNSKRLAWIMLLEEHLFQKVSRLCLKRFEDHCFYELNLMYARIAMFTGE